MTGFSWGREEAGRLDAIREDLAQVSTATAFHMLLQMGWRNTYMRGVLPLQPLGLGQRLVGRARTCRYLMRRGAEGQPNREARRRSPEIVLIESLEPGDVFCVDALGPEALRPVVSIAPGVEDVAAARLAEAGVRATRCATIRAGRRQGG